jgi:hypothetical protein
VLQRSISPLLAAANSLELLPKGCPVQPFYIGRLTLIFSSFFTARADDRAVIEKIVSEIVRDINPVLTVTRMEAMSVNKTTRILEKTIKRIKEYQSNEKFGYLRRVKFINAFQWQLKDVGFSKEFVLLITEMLIATSVQTPPK